MWLFCWNSYINYCYSSCWCWFGVWVIGKCCWYSLQHSLVFWNCLCGLLLVELGISFGNISWLKHAILSSISVNILKFSPVFHCDYSRLEFSALIGGFSMHVTCYPELRTEDVHPYWGVYLFIFGDFDVLIEILLWSI